MSRYRVFPQFYIRATAVEMITCNRERVLEQLVGFSPTYIFSRSCGQYVRVTDTGSTDPPRICTGGAHRRLSRYRRSGAQPVEHRATPCAPAPVLRRVRESRRRTSRAASLFRPRTATVHGRSHRESLRLGRCGSSTRVNEGHPRRESRYSRRSTPVALRGCWFRRRRPELIDVVIVVRECAVNITQTEIGV